jgi:hypothetical protein
MPESDFSEFSWLLCCFSLSIHWKLTFRLSDLDEALDDYFASLFNKSESLDCLLLPESILFLENNCGCLQLKFRAIRHDVN